mmetsp:Transcript_56940/g.169885  ORF Transcript_56940/g.169885 Transcript_56940/m.169885 type:complete len:153 (-) Transcript_56940:27-485(-)
MAHPDGAVIVITRKTYPDGSIIVTTKNGSHATESKDTSSTDQTKAANGNTQASNSSYISMMESGTGGFFDEDQGIGLHSNTEGAELNASDLSEYESRGCCSSLSSTQKCSCFALVVTIVGAIVVAYFQHETRKICERAVVDYIASEGRCDWD